MKTIIADHSVWPKFEPWQPYPRDILGRAIPNPSKKKKKPSISYEGQIKKLIKQLKA
jgi:hypothetical protein